MPTLGSTVFYTLSETDAAAINQRRIDLNIVGLRVFVGYEAEAGQTFPAQVVRSTPGIDAVNLQVCLDGTDIYWVRDRIEGDPGEQGTWVLPASS